MVSLSDAMWSVVRIPAFLKDVLVRLNFRNAQQQQEEEEQQQQQLSRLRTSKKEGHGFSISSSRGSPTSRLELVPSLVIGQPAQTRPVTRNQRRDRVLYSPCMSRFTGEVEQVIACQG